MKIFLFILFSFSAVFQFDSFANEADKLMKANDLVWVKPKANSYRAQLNQSMEVGMNFGKSIDSKFFNYVTGKKGNYINPYNPEDADVSAVFTSPSGKTKKGIGFYFQDFRENLQKDKFEEKFTENPWRLRFAPDEIGKWTVEVQAIIKGQAKPIIYTLQFRCVTSEHKGAIKTVKTNTDKDRFLYYRQTEERFITNGMNVSSGGFFTYKPSQNNRQMRGVEKLAAAKANFVRFEIGAQGALPDWYDLFNYQNKQDEMYGFDRLMNCAEENQIYAILFRHHVEILGDAWDVPNWKKNPYRQHFDFKKIREYYTNPEAIKLQNNNLRYMYARWGFSPYWSFYGYSELEKFINPMIEQEGLSDEEGIAIFKKWFEDQKEYILTELNPDALFANSYGIMKKPEAKKNFDGILKASDVTSVHVYSTIKNMNFGNRAEAVEDFWDYYHQPVILEEMGINSDKLPLNCCTGIDFHNSLWSTTFMGSTGAGLDWWWDRGIIDMGYEIDMKELDKFLQPLKKSTQNFRPYRWADANQKSRLLETFALISEDNKEIYGWLHNASYFWRNDINNECLQSLLDSSNLVQPCAVGDNMRLGRNERATDYANDRHSDKYTSKGGFQPINGDLKNNPSFKVNKVLKGRGKNRAWYKVNFYSTQPGDNLVIISSQYIRAGFGKNLKITIPNLNDEHPDVAFQITFVKRGKTKPINRPPPRWL